MAQMPQTKSTPEPEAGLAASPHSAAPYISAYAAAFQGADGDACLYSPMIGARDFPMQHVASGTSVAVAQWQPAAGGEQYAYAFVASIGGGMCTWDPQNGLLTHGTAMPNTSPSITTLRNGDYAVAFQGPNGSLHTFDFALGLLDRGLGMMAGTSPSISGYSAAQLYAVAFQANTGNLWTMDPYLAPNPQDRHLGMMAGTSPSISTYTNEKLYAVAFQANTGNLWTMDPYLAPNAQDRHLGMLSKTSPSIRTYPNKLLYAVAFQANTGTLWTLDPSGAHETGEHMYPGTSPSLAQFASPQGLALNYAIASLVQQPGGLWTTDIVTAPQSAAITSVTLQVAGSMTSLTEGFVTHDGASTSALLPGHASSQLNGKPVNGMYSVSVTGTGLYDGALELRVDW